jgi:hypothetical protein
MIDTVPNITEESRALLLGLTSGNAGNTRDHETAQSQVDFNPLSWRTKMSHTNGHTLQDAAPLQIRFPATRGTAHRLTSAVANMLTARHSTYVDPARLYRMNAYAPRDIEITRADLALGPMDTF